MGLPLPPVPYTKKFSQIVSDFAAAAQASSNSPLDFSDGSVFLALAQATGGNADWMQKLYVFALLITRLATSQGQWVDTWTADFMPAVAGTQSPRLPANNAIGQATFSSSTYTAQRIIPVGALAATTSGLVYLVFADPSNSAYNPTIIPGGGFVIPAGQQDLTVSIQALKSGSAANVQANTITVIQSGVVGVDSVTNPAPVTTGVDQESDPALKTRFQLFIQSLREGTDAAIEYAVTSLQQGLQCTIHDNVDPWTGATDYGVVTVYVYGGATSASAITSAQTTTSSNVLYFTSLPSSVVTGLTVQDATNINSILSGQTITGIQEVDSVWQVTLSANVDGTVSSGDSITFNSSVQLAANAVSAVRAGSVRTMVVGARTTLANISMTLSTAVGYNANTVIAAVQNAIGTYVNNLSLEQTLPYSMLATIAYQASTGVTNVTNVLLNSGTSDLTPSAGYIIRIGTNSVVS